MRATHTKKLANTRAQLDRNVNPFIWLFMFLWSITTVFFGWCCCCFYYCFAHGVANAVAGFKSTLFFSPVLFVFSQYQSCPLSVYHYRCVVAWKLWFRVWLQFDLLLCSLFFCLLIWFLTVVRLVGSVTHRSVLSVCLSCLLFLIGAMKVILIKLMPKTKQKND